MREGLYVRKGDTVFTRSTSLLGRLIRWGESDPDETNGAWTNHSLKVVEDGWLVPPDATISNLAVVVEALWHVERHAWWTAHRAEYERGTRVRAYRPVPEYTPAELLRLEVAANNFVGDRYGWWKLAGFLVKRATRGHVDPTRWYFIKGRPICSYATAWIDQEARPLGTVAGNAFWPGYGMPPQSADPDEQEDFCRTEPRYWQFVGEA